MDWLQLLWAAFVAATVLLLPGLLAAWLIGLRGLWAAAVAPLISISLWVIAATALPWVGLGWTPEIAIPTVTVLALLIVAFFRGVLKPRFLRRTTAPLPRWVTPVAWAMGAAVIGGTFVAGVGSADAISQTYDNIFHLNLVAYTTDTLNASSLSAGLLVSPGAGSAFYPNAWHAVVALVQMLAGVSIPFAVNGVTLAGVLVVWPAGMLLLVRQLVPASPVTVLSTGVLLAALPSMPLNLVNYGVLYSFFFGLILVPAMLALVLQLLGLSAQGRIGRLGGVLTLLIGVVPGITIAHPGAMMAALALSVPAAAVATLRGWQSIPVSRRLVRLAGLALFGVVGLMMLKELRPSVEATWQPLYSLTGALVETVSLQLLGYGLPIVLALLVLVGIVGALRRRSAPDITLVLMWAVAATMFFIAAGMWLGRFRILTVGVWYGDTPRLAAIFAIALVPLAVLGIDRLWNMLPQRKGQRVGFSRGIIVGVLVAIQLLAGWPQFLADMRFIYRMDEESPLVSSDEQKLLDRLPDLVPEGDVIVGSPWTGTALAYALSDREVVLPHVTATPNSEQALILAKLQKAATDPEVCEAVRTERVFYVLDFGPREVHGATHSYPGIERLDSSDAVELVANEGVAKLFRVTACGE